MEFDFIANQLLLLFKGEKCHDTDVSDPAMGDHDTVDPSVCKGNLDLGKSDMQFGSQILSNKEESINKSAASDMPEPEKMLSLAYQHNGEANNLLVESTPHNQGIFEGLTDAGVQCISGKKRSFTESTLTVQSVDLVESYGGAQSKRTAESVPDDDDLLSSILGITMVLYAFCFIFLATVCICLVNKVVAEKNLLFLQLVEDLQF